MSTAPPSSPADVVTDVAAVQQILSMVSEIQLGFTAALQQIADETLALLADADGVGLAYLEDGHVVQLASTNALATDADDVQYSLTEGPCITAALENHTMIVPSLTRESRWPNFRAGVGHLDVHSVLSLPLDAGGQVIGALNVYARADGSLDQQVARKGEEHARSAARALQQAVMVKRARRLVARVEAAVARSRAVNRAVGLIMVQDGLDQTRALGVLNAFAHVHEVDLGAAAQLIWQEREHRQQFLETLRCGGAADGSGWGDRA